MDIHPRFKTKHIFRIEKLGRIRFRAVLVCGWFRSKLEWIAEEEVKETFCYVSIIGEDIDLNKQEKYTQTYWRHMKPEDSLMLQFTVPAT